MTWINRLAPHVRVLAVFFCACATVAGLGLLTNAWEWVSGPGPFHRLPVTFTIWDTEPIRRHAFLLFLEPSDIQQGHPYAHATSAWLLAVYAVMKPLQLAGVPYEAGQHGMIIITFVLMLALLWDAFDRTAFIDATRSPVTQAKLAGLAVLALAIVGTIPAFWIGSLIGDPTDQNRLLASLVFAYISVRDYRGQPLGRAGLVAAIVLALVVPMYTPFLILTLWILGAGERGRTDGSGLRWREWGRESAILLLLGAASVAQPYGSARLAGLHATGSDLFFRTGLDGDTTYFTNMARAVFAPWAHADRHWMLTPLPIAAIGIAAVVGGRSTGGRMLRQLLVAATPALFFIAVFPQAVSIHPYQYDFGLVFPAAFCIVFWLMESAVHQRLAGRGAVILGLYLVLTALLASNLIDLARLKHLKRPYAVACARTSAATNT